MRVCGRPSEKSTQLAFAGPARARESSCRFCNIKDACSIKTQENMHPCFARFLMAWAFTDLEETVNNQNAFHLLKVGAVAPG